MILRFFVFSMAVALNTLAIVAKAEAVSDQLVIHYTNGTNVGISLSEMPQITFSEADLCVNGLSTNLKCSLEDIAYYSFTGYNVGKADIDLPDVSITREGGLIKIMSSGKKADLALFDIRGLKIAMESSQDGNYHIVNTLLLEPGVYLLSINGRAIKFVKE